MKPDICDINIANATKRNIIFMICLVMFIGTGCNKQSEFGNRTLSGQVVDQTTGEGIPFVKLGLIDDQSYLPDTFGNDGHFTTDANGFFKFSVQEHEKTDYYINAIADNYFNDFPISMYNLGSGIPLLPKGYLNLHFTAPNQNDSVIFRATITQYKLNKFIITKTYNDTISQSEVLKRAINGNMMNHFSWTVKKDGISQIYSDSIKINAFDSANYTIAF